MIIPESVHLNLWDFEVKDISLIPSHSPHILCKPHCEIRLTTILLILLINIRRHIEETKTFNKYQLVILSQGQSAFITELLLQCKEGEKAERIMMTI